MPLCRTLLCYCTENKMKVKIKQPVWYFFFLFFFVFLTFVNVRIASMAENVCYSFVASVCELKKLDITDDGHGTHESNGRCVDVEHKYLKSRRNAQTVKTLTNDDAQTINGSHNLAYTMIPKPSTTRPQSPKTCYTRASEGTRFCSLNKFL